MDDCGAILLAMGALVTRLPLGKIQGRLAYGQRLILLLHLVIRDSCSAVANV